jgi:hypothetical protein
VQPKRVYTDPSTGSILSSRYSDPARKESRKRNKDRKKEAKKAGVQAVIERILPPPSLGISSLADTYTDFDTVRSTLTSLNVPAAAPSSPRAIDWTIVPAALDLTHCSSSSSPTTTTSTATSVTSRRKPRANDDTRIARKRSQIDSFVALIDAMNLPDASIIVDFCCGSSGLTLPLAYCFPEFTFVGVDLKQKALDIMTERIEALGLDNVTTSCTDVAAYASTYSLAISLHSCGQASDAVILSAVNQSKPFFVAPCCVGKVKFSLGTARPSKQKNHDPRDSIKHFAATATANLGLEYTNLEYPRSEWLKEAFCVVIEDSTEGGGAEESRSRDVVFSNIAEAADNSTAAPSSSDSGFYDNCKAVMNLDRVLFARERAGYDVRVCKMLGSPGAKNDLLCGFVR